MLQLIKRFAREEEGLETVEYAVMGALVVIVGIATAGALGTKIAAKFQALTTAMN
jgi:Flp pilus assembly pilin Flp